jgi:hypothetical protein
MTRAASPASAFGRFMLLMTSMGMLGACQPSPAAPGQAQENAKENHAMTTPATTPPTADLSATQALQGMLELIRGNQTIADVTPESMQHAWGVPFKIIDPQQFGYGQRLPGNWAFSVQRLTETAGPRVDLIFDPLPGKQASPVDICEPDFARFTAALESMGFQRNTSHGEHNRWTFDAFERPGMHVEVYPTVAQTNNGEPVGPTCVKMVLVR